MATDAYISVGLAVKELKRLRQLTEAELSERHGGSYFI
jgi:hypothetical protein